MREKSIMPAKAAKAPAKSNKVLVMPLFIKGDILKVKWATKAYPKAIFTWNATVVVPTPGQTTVSYRENIGKQVEDVLPNPDLITYSVSVVKSKRTGTVAPLPPPPPKPKNPRVMILGDDMRFTRLTPDMELPIIAAYLTLISNPGTPNTIRITSASGVICIANFKAMTFGVQQMKDILD